MSDYEDRANRAAQALTAAGYDVYEDYRFVHGEFDAIDGERHYVSVTHGDHDHQTQWNNFKPEGSQFTPRGSWSPNTGIHTTTQAEIDFVNKINKITGFPELNTNHYKAKEES